MKLPRLFNRFKTRKFKFVGLGVLLLAVLIGGGLFVGWQYFDWFQPKISVVSDVPGISVKLAKSEKFNEHLTTWGFWKENGVLTWGEEKLVTVKRLVVHLTDKEQQYYQFTDEEGKVISATGERYESNGTYHLFVFIPRETLESAPAENLPAAFEAYTLRPLLIASIDDPSLPEKARKAKIDSHLTQINDILDSDTRLFKLERK